MRRPAVFFDRDNTLIVGHDYLGDPAQVKLVAGAGAAVAKCRAMGFATVVVSNQSGVARGMFSEKDVRAVNAKMDAELLSHHPQAVIDRHEFCPFHPDAKVPAYKQDSFLRKPKPGMILAAADAMALDLARSWVVGDAPRDIAAGKAAGCRTILITDPSLTPSPAASETAQVKPDFSVNTLIEAIEVIARQSHRASTVASEQAEDANANDSQAEAAADTSSQIAPPSVTTAPPARAVPVKLANPSATPQVAPTKPIDLSRLEMTAQQILLELKRANEAHQHDDFSVSKLVAGIVQVLAVAALMLGYFLYRNDVASLQSWLLVAIFLQAFTVALLIMSRQK